MRFEYKLRNSLRVENKTHKKKSLILYKKNKNTETSLLKDESLLIYIMGLYIFIWQKTKNNIQIEIVEVFILMKKSL